jgi:hypothetical protein
MDREQSPADYNHIDAELWSQKPMQELLGDERLKGLTLDHKRLIEQLVKMTERKFTRSVLVELHNVVNQPDRVISLLEEVVTRNKPLLGDGVARNLRDQKELEVRVAHAETLLKIARDIGGYAVWPVQIALTKMPAI